MKTTNSKRGLLTVVAVLLAVALAILIWPKKEEPLRLPVTDNGKVTQENFEKNFQPYAGDFCEISQEITEVDIKSGVELVKVPKGTVMTVTVNGKSFTGKTPSESWLLRKGSDLKTVNGYLENYTLDNFENLEKQGYKIIEFPGKMAVKDAIEFCKKHEFDARIDGFLVENLDHLDQTANWTDTLVFNPECSPRFLAVNKSTGDVKGTNWDGNCWRLREESQAIRGEKFYPEIKFKYLVEANFEPEPSEKLTVKN